MKERPILFSGSMVRAILEGRKTQTRRVVKFHAPFTDHNSWKAVYPHPVSGFIFTDKPLPEKYRNAILVRMAGGREGKVSPYGIPGDRLWVREAWADLRGMGFGNDPRTDKPFDVAFAADTKPGSHGDEIRKDYGVKWTPSIHMPRWASRITLEITEVRIQRVQEISEEDALAEGVEKVGQAFGISSYPMYGSLYDKHEQVTRDPKYSFQCLWDSINEKRGFGWDINPWVWVIAFRRVTP
jgi:hypothetical protein